MNKSLRRFLDEATGARLCYGEPIRAGDRTVIPVARVRVSGGWGFGGRGDDGGRKSGGGGGGALDAAPIGFIEVTPEGARYHEVRDPEQLGRTLRAGAKAAATVLTGVAGMRALRGGRRRRPAGLLPRGRGRG